MDYKEFEKFLIKANNKFNNKFDYSKVEYVDDVTKVKIICPTHGEFEQSPKNHLRAKHGCKECSLIGVGQINSMSFEEFLFMVKKAHGDKFDYSKSEYKNLASNIKIICPIHGEFEQVAQTHLTSKHGCSKCADKVCANKRKTSDVDFIKQANKAHNNKFDYSKVKYVNNRVKIKITCPLHGEFEQKPLVHINSLYGCPKCINIGVKKTKAIDVNIFIKRANKIHNNKFDYSQMDYINARKKIKIICPIHGEFEQTPDSHVNKKSGCPKCSLFSTSKPEIELIDFIKTFETNITLSDRTIIKPKHLDIYIEHKKLAFEFNGLYWHSTNRVTKNYHIDKTNKCAKLGIRLIHIFEDEWLYKQEIIKSKIKHIFGLTENKIHGRKCIIKEIDNNTSNEFMNENHIEGESDSDVNIGLYYNDVLVFVLSIKDNEIIRFANKLNYVVIGGFNKSLNYFIKTYKPNEIISYIDIRWSEGKIYENNGFELIEKSKPNLFYVVSVKRYKTLPRKLKLKNRYKIYDCGTKKYKKSFTY